MSEIFLSIEYTAKGGGYFRVFVDGVQVSRHTAEREALERGANEAEKNPGANVHVDHDYMVEILVGSAGGGDPGVDQDDGGGGGSNPIDPAILSNWETAMVDGGARHGQTGYNIPGVNDWYYDNQYVMLRIRDYTGDSSPWQTYANQAGQAYRDHALAQPTPYRVGGNQVFPHGWYNDYIDGGTATEAEVRILASSTQTWYDGWRFNNDSFLKGETAVMMREVAYSLQANIYREKLGDARVVDRADEGVGTTRMEWFIRFAASGLQECRTQTYWTDTAPGYPYDPSVCKPFYLGLISHALIEFYEWEVLNGRNPDAYWPTTNLLTGNSIPWTGIQDCLEEFWTWMRLEATTENGTRMYVAADSRDGLPSWVYDDHSTSSNGERDLDLLVMPVFGWLWKQTGNDQYATWGDAMFQGGVNWALNRGNFGVPMGGNGAQKPFSQAFRWSFDYVTWRNS